MTTTDKNIFLQVCELYLSNMKERKKRGCAIEKFLYNKSNNTLKVPEILWETAGYICDECLGTNTGTGYSSYKSRCRCVLEKEETIWKECETGWMFLCKDNQFKNITISPSPDNILRCGLSTEEQEKLQEMWKELGLQDCHFKLWFAALLVNESLNQYDTERECYIPKHFYDAVMITFFLFSFDAFYASLKYAVKEKLDTLYTVYKDFLSFIIELAGKTDKEVADQLFREGNSKVEELICCAISDVLDDPEMQGNELLKCLIGVIDVFCDKMKSSELKEFLSTNGAMAEEIFGKPLYKKIDSALQVFTC